MASSERNLNKVAIVSSPGMGHLIPLVQLAKTLVHRYSLEVTFLIPTMLPPSDAQKALLETLPSSISYVYLPKPEMSDLSPDVKLSVMIVLTLIRSIDFVKDELKLIEASGCRLAALVVDFFAIDCLELAKEFNAAPYLFFSSAAAILSAFCYLPELDQKVEGEYWELDDPITFPGCVPIHGGELDDIWLDRKDDAYKWLLYMAKKRSLAAAIMVNSFVELEKGPLKALQEPQLGMQPVYAVGPLVTLEAMAHGNDSKCMDWMNNQPQGSVLYISFGSGGTLTLEQTVELAMGLEMSEQRFLWVVKSPSDGEASSAYLSVRSESDPFSFLPEGFLNRTKGRGLVVDSWAPQAKILSHGSTGGFLTHCGWNSILESVVNGVPLIAWPLFADQKMNAHMMVNDARIALRPRASSETGLIGRDEISTVARSLMVGDAGQTIRERMSCLKTAAARARSDVGASNQSLALVVADWKCS